MSKQSCVVETYSHDVSRILATVMPLVQRVMMYYESPLALDYKEALASYREEVSKPQSSWCMRFSPEVKYRASVAGINGNALARTITGLIAPPQSDGVVVKFDLSANQSYVAFSFPRKSMHYRFDLNLPNEFKLFVVKGGELIEIKQMK